MSLYYVECSCSTASLPFPPDSAGISPHRARARPPFPFPHSTVYSPCLIRSTSPICHRLIHCLPSQDLWPRSASMYNSITAFVSHLFFPRGGTFRLGFHSPSLSSLRGRSTLPTPSRAYSVLLLRFACARREILLPICRATLKNAEKDSEWK